MTGIRTALIVCSVIATIGLSYWAFINTPLTHAIGVSAICLANLMAQLELAIKEN